MTLLTDKNLKRIICRNAEKHFERIIQLPQYGGYDPAKCCLFWSTAVLLAAHKHFQGRSSFQLQGGCASWRIVPKDKDDGVSPTHYSYVYEEPEHGINSLGEVHYWVAVAPKDDPEGHGLIVDMTTKYVPELARSKGINVLCWPPNVIWSSIRDIPPGDWLYEPMMEPTLKGNFLLHEILHEIILHEILGAL